MRSAKRSVAAGAVAGLCGLVLGRRSAGSLPGAPAPAALLAAAALPARQNPAYASAPTCRTAASTLAGSSCSQPGQCARRQDSKGSEPPAPSAPSTVNRTGSPGGTRTASAEER
jgi:hypothetical protein